MYVTFVARNDLEDFARILLYFHLIMSKLLLCPISLLRSLFILSSSLSVDYKQQFKLGYVSMLKEVLDSSKKKKIYIYI